PSLLCFSLYCYRALRHLHSFPTRRSSDLARHPPALPRGRFPLRCSCSSRAWWNSLSLVLRWTTPRPELPRTSPRGRQRAAATARSEEHTSELQSRENLVCRLLLEKKKNT